MAAEVAVAVQRDGGGSKTLAWALGAGKAAGERAQGKVGDSPEVRHKGMMYGAAKLLVYKRILGELGLDQCRHAGMVGVPCSDSAQELLLSVGLPVLGLYGSSECSGLAAVSTAKACDKKPGYRVGQAGRALPGSNVAVDNRRVGNAGGRFGELAVQGRNVMLGYYRDPVSNMEVFVNGGILITGDMGSIDPVTKLVTVSRRPRCFGVCQLREVFLPVCAAWGGCE